MSGGHFDYSQYKLQDMADSIAHEIEENGKTNAHGYKREYTPETISAFKMAIVHLKLAQTYVHRIDWFLSGDDDEDNFITRLKAELAALPPSAAEVK